MLKGDAKTAYQREYMRRRRAGLKTEPKAKAAPASPARDAEIERLRAEVEELRKAKAAPAPSHELAEARAEIKRLQAELHKAALDFTKLQGKIAKPPPLDPESEFARQIDAQKKKYKALEQKNHKLVVMLKAMVPPAVKTKIAKALNETQTSPEKRLDALQAWNGRGLNNIGKE